jgi:hypothetical protein
MTLWVVLALGLFVGFLIGRWSAETFRARSDMSRVWEGRKGYRQ